MNKLSLKVLRFRQKINKLNITGPCYIHPSAQFANHRGIHISAYSRVGADCHLNGEGGILIREGTILGPRVTILSSNHNYDQDELLPYNFTDHLRPIEIGRGCWIGANATIVPGVKIGDGVVVAMGAVVSKDIESGIIVAGNPAKEIKKRSKEYKNLILNNSYFLKDKIEKGITRTSRINNNYKLFLIK
jgi:maltose O-acetyltransferase